jgi:hypothetical protein
MRAARQITILLTFATLLIGTATNAAAQTSPGAQPAPAVTTQRVGGWSVTPYIGFGFSGELASAAAAAFGVAGLYAWNSSERSRVT